MNEKLLEYFNNDELAASVWLNKYADEGEITPDDMHRRLAKEFAKVEENYQIDEKKDYEDASFDLDNLSKYCLERENLTEETIYSLFKDFKYIVPQGSIMSQLGTKSIGSLSNCFVIGQPHDSYGGIFQKDEEMAQLEKRRGGVGLDISTLRPEGVATTNAAKSSTGAISFMHRFSNTTNEVAQNGRRGALMLSIDINHPDVLEFIKIKRDLTKVTGANISIKLNDEFMKAVENDERYILRFPCNLNETLDWWNELEEMKNDDDVPLNELHPVKSREEIDDEILHGYTKVIKAKEYWDEIIKSAHGVAEPGLMFWDNMVNYSPDGVYDQFRQVTTNPCSEIAMQPYDACRLIAVNLYSFVKNPFTSEAEFDFDEFYKVNYEAMRLSDDLIDLEMNHIQKILDKIDADPEPEEVKATERALWQKVFDVAKSSRRTGLGFTALGDTLAALGLKYDEDNALNMIENIMDNKIASELDCTIDLAILRGTFDGWSRAIELHKNHNITVDGENLPFIGENDFYKFIVKQYPDQADRMAKYGRRNVSWSTVAPTGTVSLMTQTTSGIEPLFQPFYMRRKKVNPNDKDVRVDFVDEVGLSWQEFPVLHPKFKQWCIINHPHYGDVESPNYGKVDIDFENIPKDVLQEMFEESPWFGSTANDIDWVKKDLLNMMHLKDQR